MPPKKRSSGSGTPTSRESKCSNRKENSVLSPEKHKDKHPEFVTLCKDLSVSNSLCCQAWAMWESITPDEIIESNKQLWGACVYVSAVDLDEIRFTFTEFQKAVGLSVKQFLTLMRKLDENLDTISHKVNSAVTRLAKKYEVSLALYQRFVKTCAKIYGVPDEVKGQELLRCNWTLFLLAKGSVLQMEDDLVIAFQLLLCVLEFYIKRCPSSLLQPLYKSAISETTQSPPTRTSRRNKAKPRPLEMDVQLLETLCKESDCSIDEVKNVYQSSFCAFLDSMGFSGLQELPAVETLSKSYEELYHKSKDFDARLFLDNDETLSPVKAEVTKVEMTPRKNPPGEENVSIPPQTPIRAAMYSIQQLRGELTSISDQPSGILMNYFENCTVNPSEDITKRVEHLGQVFSQKFAQAVGQCCEGLGKKRFTLGVQLYYKVMESMLKSEEKRLSVQNFSKLLNNATFHTSLLACSLEVVLATYVGCSLKNGGSKSPETNLCFPWILDVFQLHAFDFYKVIESFIKELTLKHDMLEHLSRCENQIMESIAWKSDSLLFELLRQSREDGPGEQAEPPATLNQPLQHDHTAADLYLSPQRQSRRFAAAEVEVPVIAPSQLPASGNRQHRSNSLSLFYKKLYRMAYLRLKTLFSELLTAHPELEAIIWTLLQHTLQNEYELMKDRHLDQLMMSAMYAICKVKNVDLRFKTIVTAYKALSNTNQETFKRVLIRDGQYDSIIVFYNQVFMQKLKTNILQYASTRPPPLSPIPHIPRSPYMYPSSPLRVPGGNVYISPLKSNRLTTAAMTPRTKFLVSIGESFGSSDKFQKINQMVNSTDRALKRSLAGDPNLKPHKRLRFDVDGQDEADGSKSTGESTLDKKLAEMRSVRNRMQEQKMKEEAEKEDPEP
ncbi:retinoblastoma-associated protein [Tachysurus fulvidraco]|uniref:retinoblastoma-associated protein n=1 Tax=Tachysurus fulvidraco TaxID=1234273 RepID=UPI001FEF0DB7|nr:retinoblastoma-associated protein [Tachysurus fulvidraco]